MAWVPGAQYADTSNHWVAGSNPATTLGWCSSAAEQANQHSAHV